MESLFKMHEHLKFRHQNFRIVQNCYRVLGIVIVIVIVIVITAIGIVIVIFLGVNRPVNSSPF